MRSMIALALLPLCTLATPARAEGAVLALDTALLDDVVETLAQAAPQTSSTFALPVALAAAEHQAAAAPNGRTLGIGLQVGAPTALTLKFMTGATQGVVVGVGAGFGWRGGFGAGLSLHVDYLFDVAQLVKNDTLGLSFYIGPGLWVSLFNGGYGFGVGYYYAPSWGYFGIAGRVPMGLSMAFTAAPIEVYLELDPALFVFPGLDFGLGASLGFRFYL